MKRIKKKYKLTKRGEFLLNLLTALFAAGCFYIWIVLMIAAFG